MEETKFDCCTGYQGWVAWQGQQYKQSHHCPSNYNDSSKSMEAYGAVSMITSIYDGGKTCIDILLGDDDYNTWSNVWHSYKEEILDANPQLWKADIWPKTQEGSYTAGRGKLPLLTST